MDLSSISSMLGLDIIWPDGKPKKVEIKKVAPIETAEEGDITFLGNPDYRTYLSSCKASAIIVKKVEKDWHILEM